MLIKHIAYVKPSQANICSIQYDMSMKKKHFYDAVRLYTIQHHF